MPLFRVLFAVLACFTLLLLAGCPSKYIATDPGKTGTTSKGSGTRGTKPYTIKGKTYHPLISAHGFREEGIASWYGPDFHGKLTANGERYDMHGMTAAHKLLPFGTQVRVTNLSNNRSITVRINDRGPFVGDRVIDLTRTGADKLGMIAAGTARVSLETIGTVPGLKDGDITGKFYVQVGAFSRQGNAQNLAMKIQAQNRSARVVYAPNINFWRVQIGPYASLNAAENASDILRREYQGNFVVAE